MIHCPTNFLISTKQRVWQIQKFLWEAFFHQWYKMFTMEPVELSVEDQIEVLLDDRIKGLFKNPHPPTCFLHSSTAGQSMVLKFNSQEPSLDGDVKAFYTSKVVVSSGQRVEICEATVNKRGKTWQTQWSLRITASKAHLIFRGKHTHKHIDMLSSCTMGCYEKKVPSI